MSEMLKGKMRIEVPFLPPVELLDEIKELEEE
ncbi:hypothetical protein ES705_31518 [subsurface metagenome]